MRRRIYIIVFVLVTQLFAFAQNDLASVKEMFNSFQYEKVITQAESILENDSLNRDVSIELLRMKAIAHYVLNQKDFTVLCFVDILKKNPEYQLDPRQNSPKIINIFNRTKDNYLPAEKEITNRQTTQQEVQPVIQKQFVRSSLLRSFAVPGWGHLYANNQKKGYFLTSAALVGLGASIYFTIETAQNEKRYLNETDKTLIESKYKDYNRSFQLRNGFLIGYAILWTYAQADLTYQLFSDKPQNVSGMVTEDFVILKYTYNF